MRQGILFFGANRESPTGSEYDIGLRKTFCSFVKVTFPLFQKATFVASQPLKRQSRLKQTTNFATFFLFFKKKV